MHGKWNWYLTIAAVRQYMALTGLRGDLEDDNPDFVRAQNELGDLSLTARLADAEPTQSGAVRYRGKITLRGRRQRVECTVMPAGRDEGVLPQLLRVTLK